ncbi:uncharacterized protein LOC143431607 [Xylocopa sonorina]|uniref:uncharacterized protein LOC143431607 n=1 Tax=Xylocopa sonorina TaxID=1818115 RepID=UPI00403AAC6F
MVSNRTVAPADGSLLKQYKARWPSGGDGSWNVRLENWWSWRSADGLVMAEFNIDIGKLPEDVREKLAELDLELSEDRLKQYTRSPSKRDVMRNPLEVSFEISRL